MKAWILSLLLLLSTVGNAWAQTFPARAQTIVESLHVQHLDLAHGDDDERRALTRLIIEQIVFELGSSWGGKSADPTRPFSKDSIAHIGSGGVLWGCDWQNGATRQPFRPVVCQDITGQNFIPVAGRNHLGAEPQPPTGEPVPLPPLPAVDLSPVLNRLDVLLAAQGEQRAQAERIFRDLSNQNKALLDRLLEVERRLIQHDEEPGWLKKFFSNRYVQVIGAGLIAKLGLPALVN